MRASQLQKNHQKTNKCCLMKTEVQRLEKSKIKLTVTLPAEEVEEAFKKAVAEAAKTAEIKGFRKGKAPLAEVEKHLDQGKLNGQIINLLVPTAYTKAIKQKDLKPITDPRIEIKKFARGNEFIFEVEISEAPEVDLGDWEKALKSLSQKSKIETAATITEAKNKAQNKEVAVSPWGANPPKARQERAATNHRDSETNPKTITTDTALKTVTDEAKIEVPQMLIEDEVNRMLTRLYDHLGTLGLSPEDYLKNHGQTKETLRLEYAEQARSILKTEFVLSKLSEELKIEVKDEEIEQAIKAVNDEKTRESLKAPQNRTYIKAIIRKTKTMEKLVEIAERDTQP